MEDGDPVRRVGQAERARWAAEAEAEAKAAIMTAQADRERARRKVLTEITSVMAHDAEHEMYR